MIPFVGRPCPDYRAVCGYSKQPGSPQCPQVAVLHLLVGCPTHHLVTLSACVEHIDVARRAGTVQQEHAFDTGACGLPGFVWNVDVNRCVIDDSGVEPVLAGAVLAGATS